MPRLRAWDHLSTSSVCSNRIDELQAPEVLLVARHKDATVCIGNGGNHHVDRASWTPGSCPFGHQTPPDQGCFFIEWKNVPGKHGLWTIRPREPALQLSASPAGRLFFDSSPDFRNTQGSDEEVFLRLIHKPVGQQLRWHGLCGVAENVCVEQVTTHRSISLGLTTGRLRFRSARGQLRSMVRIPPFLRVSGAIFSRTDARISAACASFSASRRANVRTSSRSELSPRTSNRAMPRLLRRLR
jgi:hypothetical protein